jgi:hypothetical protein
MFLQGLHKPLPIDILEWISKPSNFWIPANRSKMGDAGGQNRKFVDKTTRLIAGSDTSAPSKGAGLSVHLPLPPSPGWRQVHRGRRSLFSGKKPTITAG